MQSSRIRRPFALGAMALGLVLALAPVASQAEAPVVAPLVKYDYDQDIFHPVYARHGMVAAEQELASHIGVDVLKRGGNAVDAAVSVAYALAVTFPEAGNIGGGGFMTVRMADGRTAFIDFRETAPAAATATMYQDASGKLIPGKSTRGHLAAGIPGTVAGLELALGKYRSEERRVGKECRL